MRTKQSSLRSKNAMMRAGRVNHELADRLRARRRRKHVHRPTRKMIREGRGRQLRRGLFSPFKPGDDIEALARKLLREKSIGGSGFYGPLNYPRQSFH